MLSRLSALLVSALLVACEAGSSTTIKGNGCPGCRAADGTCVAGTAVSACGTAGAACMACEAGLACEAGACVMPGGSGGGSGGGAGGTGGGSGAGGGGGLTPDGGLEDCSAAAKLVYVVDSDRTLSSFDPVKVGTSGGPFVDLGKISCAAQSGAEPFSMSVDRDAVAWVIYDSGELFKVPLTQTPLTCAKTTFAPQNNVAKFGMGFVSNAAGSRDETLFISGSDFNSSLTTTKFGTIGTTPPYTVTVLGTLSGAPEITGTGDAKLWAFFPNLATPQVARLDKASGAKVQTFNASSLSGDPLAWAFAFWGGDFWIFLERVSDASTTVWKMDGMTGAVSVAVPNTGRRIVGAGVSTCAPVEIN
jgi:hypothetical protein